MSSFTARAAPRGENSPYSRKPSHANESTGYSWSSGALGHHPKHSHLPSGNSDGLVTLKHFTQVLEKKKHAYTPLGYSRTSLGQLVLLAAARCLKFVPRDHPACSSHSPSEEPPQHVAFLSTQPNCQQPPNRVLLAPWRQKMLSYFELQEGQLSARVWAWWGEVWGGVWGIPGEQTGLCWGLNAGLGWGEQAGRLECT